MRKFVVCIDSDGCAMDTMTLKHEDYFGPFASEEFKIDNSEEFNKEWNRVNLYSIQRGINRFESLALFLEKYKKNIKIENLDITPVINWVENTNSLSEKSLEDEIQKSPNSQVLKIALKWSKRVNEAITMRDSSDYKAFENVREVMEKISKVADIVVVSSANKKAVLEEWENNGIIDFPTEINTQEDGTKKAIVKSVLDRGVGVDNILMVGDATKDRDAALDNGVLFYPILAKHESKSWFELGDKILDIFLNLGYRGKIQDEYLDKFVENLS